MANELTITISSTDSRAVVGGAADAPPAPRPLEELGSAPDPAGAGGVQASSTPPVPLPLERLLLDEREDSSPPSPTELATTASSGDGEVPSPLPLDELAADGSLRDGKGTG